MVEYNGFIYLWYDRKTKKYCLGSHLGSTDDGYITSTGYMLRAYKKRPQDFRRRIISYVYGNKKDLHEVEQFWLDMIRDSELENRKNINIRYYNMKKIARGGNGGVPHSQITKEKISIIKKGTGMGNTNPFFGKQHSKETKELLKQNLISRNNDPLFDYTKQRSKNALRNKYSNGEVQINNKTGYSGINWDNNRRKWCARIKNNNENIWLGRFDMLDDAIAARKIAEEKYWKIK